MAAWRTLGRSLRAFSPTMSTLGDDEQAAGAPAEINLAVKFSKARGSRSRAGQRVIRGEGKRVCEQLAVNERVHALEGGLFAVACRRVAILSGAASCSAVCARGRLARLRLPAASTMTSEPVTARASLSCSAAASRCASLRPRASAAPSRVSTA